MDSTSNEIQVQNIDHLGIVAGIIDEIGLVEQVDELLGRHPQEVVSLGQVLKAMILNGLGFFSAPLYLFSQFFEGKATEHLLGPGVKAEHLNDDRLGRALDHFYEYGVSEMFTTLALRAADQFEVEVKRVHLDSTSLSVEGAYVKAAAESASESGEAVHPVEITYGYSRDRRPDLKQFLMNTICSGDGDVPLYLRVADGNETDGVGFGKVVVEYREQWHFDGILVGDAALYTAKNLQAMGTLKWISRVPLTLSQAQVLLRQVVPFAEWEGLAKGYRLIEVCTIYAGIQQRWVVVESEERRAADLKQLQKRIEQEEQRQKQQLEKLSKECFACEADALKAMQKFEQSLRYCSLTQVSVIEHANHAKRGRPKAGSQPQSLHYQVQATLVANPEAIAEQQVIAGRFILATNELECGSIEVFQETSLSVAENPPLQPEQDLVATPALSVNVANPSPPPEQKTLLTAVEVLAEYKRQQSSERGFRFLKDPLFFTSSVFLKSPQRIMALAMVMALCLLVYTLAQRKLRQALSAAQSAIPNQLGKLTDKPTMRWVFQCFQAIHLVIVEGRKQITHLTPLRRKILQFLGAPCGRYYLLQ